MICPTCEYPRQQIGNADAGGIAWCPRCGTIGFLASQGDQKRLAVQPLLIERCRKFGATLGPAWGQLWIGQGIEESIFPQSQRRDVGSDT